MSAVATKVRVVVTGIFLAAALMMYLYARERAKVAQVIEQAARDTIARQDHRIKDLRQSVRVLDSLLRARSETLRTTNRTASQWRSRYDSLRHVAGPLPVHDTAWVDSIIYVADSMKASAVADSAACSLVLLTCKARGDSLAKRVIADSTRATQWQRIAEADAPKWYVKWSSRAAWFLAGWRTRKATHR